MKKSSIGVLGALSACLLLLCISAQAQMNRLDSPSYLCVCPGDTLMYNCTINGGGSTLWTGTEFNCQSSNHEIILRHSQFSNPDGESGACNNGTIVGRSLTDGSGMVFISQLTVPVSLSSVGANVRCIYDNGGVMTTVDTSTISLISTPYAEPGNLTLSHANRGLVTFSWSPVDCPLSYRISSTCGDCPSSTNNTDVDCSVTDLSAEDSACEFSVQSVACGSFVSTSNRISPKVNAPSVPDILNVLPVYYVNSTLKRVQVQFSESTSFNIYDGVDGSAEGYNISYFVGTSNSSCYSTIIPASACANGVCNHSFTVSSSCLSSADINVAVFATNVLGDSPTSIPFTTSVVNDFVTVNVNVSTSTINCTYLTGMSSSEKNCSVVYGPCSQSPTQSTQGSVNGSTNTILLSLTLDERSSTCYMFTVTASNDDYAVQVEGKNTIGGNSSGDAGVIIAVVVAILLILLLVIVVTVAVLVICFKQRKFPFKGTDNESLQMTIPLSKYEPLSEKRTITKYNVKNACELREFVVNQGLTFKRCCVFYEFTNEFERITKAQEVIHMKIDTGKKGGPIFYKRSDIVGQGGLKVKKPTDKNYIPFIQCTCSGARYLPANSYILYENTSDESKSQSEERSQSSDVPEWKFSVPVSCDAFMISQVQEACSINDFCGRVKIYKNKCNIFFEITQLGPLEFESVRDVILSEKGTTLKLSSGSEARHMVQQYCDNNSTLNPKWNVFVLLKQTRMKLAAGSLVLHQNPAYYEAEMAVLSVDDKCIQVADFLENKRNNDGNGDIQRLFYEFTRNEEDLDSFREVVITNSNDLKQECFKTDWNNYGVEKFYGLQTPGIGVKKSDSSGLRMFIQCMQDDLTRCLKPGTVVLYKKHVTRL